MSHIKYNLWQEGSTVYFRVLEMDDRFRDLEYEASNGMTVHSVDSVEITEDSIFLLGGEEEDTADYYRCDSPAEAALYIARVHEALAEWSENYEWAEGKKEIKSDQYVYEV